MGAFIPAILGGVGSLLGFLGHKKEGESQWQAQRPALEHQALQDAVRASLFSGIAGANGMGQGFFAPGMLDKLKTPVAVPQHNPGSPSILSLLGGMASGAAGSYFDMGEFEKYYKKLLGGSGGGDVLDSTSFDLGGPPVDYSLNAGIFPPRPR